MDLEVATSVVARLRVDHFALIRLFGLVIEGLVNRDPVVIRTITIGEFGRSIAAEAVGRARLGRHVDPATFTRFTQIVDIDLEPMERPVKRLVAFALGCDGRIGNLKSGFSVC